MKLSDEHKSALQEVVEHFDKEDRYVRERQIRTWKKLKFYWDNIQRLWWSEVAHDWRVWDLQTLTQDSEENDQSAYYDKPINVFRAYLESIIAALSVNIPTIKCYPDDAENSLDLSTAKAGDKISDLIYKHNNAQLLWLHALYIYCTEGLIACYSYPKEDKKFGTYEENQYENTEEDRQQKFCPICGTMLDDGASILANKELDEFQPGDDDSELHNLLINKEQMTCTNCAAQIDPEIRQNKVIVPRLVGITTKPKTRICMEVYGGLFVKVPVWARRQEDCPYLIYSYETHYSSALERFPDLKDKFGGNSKVGPGSGGIYDPYERWGRLSTQYLGEYPLNTVTVRNCWLRPEAFNILTDKDQVNELKKKFPDGCKAVLINEEVVETENESLDDCWTLTHNPLADYLHHDPLGLLLTSIQEITNDLVSLTLQTIEHGIPQTFADPTVLNFKQYRESEATPGMVIPAKPAAGKSMNDAFLTTKTASLSPEVQPFAEQIQEAGQLVSGALPALFGGAQPNSSKTAAQYSMSRQQAMQRLGITWTMLKVWWKEIFGKVIPAYIEEVQEDERIVEKDENNNFINVFVRRSDLQGKIGSVEIEASEQLPSTWAQKHDAIMQLMNLNNPAILQTLTDPENLEILTEALGLDDFTIPGTDDRTKQYEEIRDLLNSEPIQSINPQTGMPEEIPSVDIEPTVDNNPIHIVICKSWAVSEQGRLAKIENPDGYKNVLLHLQRHVNVQQMMSAPAPMPHEVMPNPNQNQPVNSGAPNA